MQVAVVDGYNTFADAELRTRDGEAVLLYCVMGLGNAQFTARIVGDDAIEVTALSDDDRPDHVSRCTVAEFVAPGAIDDWSADVVTRFLNW